MCQLHYRTSVIPKSAKYGADRSLQGRGYERKILKWQTGCEEMSWIELSEDCAQSREFVLAIINIEDILSEIQYSGWPTANFIFE
jgi:hypothetical protein